MTQTYCPPTNLPALASFLAYTANIRLSTEPGGDMPGDTDALDDIIKMARRFCFDPHDEPICDKYATGGIDVSCDKT